jgi:hypothetical protein
MPEGAVMRESTPRNALEQHLDVLVGEARAGLEEVVLPNIHALKKILLHK